MELKLSRSHVSFWQGWIGPPEADFTWNVALIRDKDTMGELLGSLVSLGPFGESEPKLIQFKLSLILHVKVCSIKVRKDPSWESKRKVETILKSSSSVKCTKQEDEERRIQEGSLWWEHAPGWRYVTMWRTLNTHLKASMPMELRI